ncbi:hypothetical protein [Desulfuromonas thiophila]|uniref:hypothetical protein n=1 Tax=Desulfuromonas thiophila TaxID=57664 RepID=UPI0024A93CF9|nr:hypothetical protein [Desulfuromonas thiophila]
MFKTAISIFLCVVVLGLTGCGTTAKFIYPADGRDLIGFSDGPAYDKKIAVTPFEEMRGDTNQSGTYFLYLIPLMPFGYGEYERPDAARMFNSISEFDFEASDDLAKAAAYSLRKSGLFRDAFFTFGGDKDQAQLLLEGEILSTTYKGKLWTYGLSVYGPLLWFFGLPAGTSANELELALKITDLTTEKVVWEKQYALNHKIVQGLYYKLGHDVRGYPYLMQEIMNDAIEDMNREFQKQGLN